MQFLNVMKDKFYQGFPNYKDGTRPKLIQLSQALTTKYDTDAHCVAYVSNVPRRLRKSVLDNPPHTNLSEYLQQNNTTLSLELLYFIADLDAPDHQFTTQWDTTVKARFQELNKLHPNMFAYRSTNGWRLFYTINPYQLCTPDDDKAWTNLYNSWRIYIKRITGLEIDESCSDWTRTFRLPHTTRDNVLQQLETIGDPHNIGLWNPTLLPQDIAEARPVRTTQAYSGRGRLVDAFDSRGWLGPELEPGKFCVQCPFNSTHTSGSDFDSSTVLWVASPGKTWGHFHCSHAHCQGIQFTELLRAFTDDELGIRNDVEIVLDTIAESHTSSGKEPHTIYNYNHLKDIMCSAAAPYIFGGLLQLDERSEEYHIDRKQVKLDHIIITARDNLFKLRRSYAAFKKEHITDAVIATAYANKYNPVQEYFASLHWDGVKRIHLLQETVFKLPDAERKPIYNSYLTKWLVAAVKRTFEPGCYFRPILVLKGEQDSGKTYFFKILGNEWFSGSPLDIENKNDLPKCSKFMIIEIAELASYSKKRDNDVKAFLTLTHDDYDKKYDKDITRAPRRCVFGASVNDAEFLTDTTGSSRYWIIDTGVHKFDYARLIQLRDQIWAEAVVLYKSAYDTLLNAAEQQNNSDLNAQYNDTDPLTDTIKDYLNTHSVVTIVEILQALGLPMEKREKTRIRRVLELNGCRKNTNDNTWRRKKDETKTVEYIPDEPESAQPKPVADIPHAVLDWNFDDIN